MDSNYELGFAQKPSAVTCDQIEFCIFLFELNDGFLHGCVSSAVGVVPRRRHHCAAAVRRWRRRRRSLEAMLRRLPSTTSLPLGQKTVPLIGADVVQDHVVVGPGLLLAVAPAVADEAALLLRTRQEAEHLADPLEAVHPPEADGQELLGEVLVEEPVDDGVCTCAGHAQDVADGVDAAEDLVGQVAEQGGAVHDRVEDVEWDPADAEDGTDPTEKFDCPFEPMKRKKRLLLSKTLTFSRNNKNRLW